MEFFNNYLKEMTSGINTIDAGALEKAAAMILEAEKKGKKVILAGNGGSAAIASHVAVDLTKNAGVRAVNFNEADLITCFANDYGYEMWLEKAIEFYADSGDLAVMISSSGKSKNIINAASKARELKMGVITFSGFSDDNPLKKIGDINFWVDSNEYNIVESVHSIWLLAMVERIINKKGKKK